MAFSFWKSAVSVVAVTVLSAVPAAAVEISLKGDASPHGRVVRLGDVADIRGVDSREAQRLADLPLMPAPTVGNHRFLRQREVQDLLAAHGEFVAQLAFVGEAVVRIDSPAATTDTANAEPTEPLTRYRAAWSGKPQPPAVTASEAESAEQHPGISAARVEELRAVLNQLFVDYLEQMSGRNANWKVSFETPTAHLMSLASATSKLTCMGGNTPWTGRQRFVVTFATPDGMARIPLHADITCSQSVAVAIRPIVPGAIVTAADVELQEFDQVPTATAKRAPFESIEPLLGLEAARPIHPGDIVMSDDVQPRILVKRGEQIMVYSRGGGFQVRVFARAKQDGARGDLITVESLETRKPFQAVVTGDGEALVYAGEAAAPQNSVAERPYLPLRTQ